jgi:HlyD family secretion protein
MVLRRWLAVGSTHQFRDGLIALCALGAITSIGLSVSASMLHLTRSPGTSEDRRTAKVVVAPIVYELGAVGEVQPAAVFVIVAPFDGFIKDKLVEIGSEVHEADPIVVMETSELDSKMRAAGGELLKAAIAVDALSNWETSSEMRRARRALASAEAQLASREQQLKNAKGLLDRGIIARNEFEGLEQQVSMQRDQVNAAQQDLQATSDRANATNKRIAELTLENARAHMAELREEAAGTIVRATRDGFIVRAPVKAASNQSERVAIERGVHLSRGQAIFAIANFDKAIVEARVSEVDVNKIRVGEAVKIQSDSFPGKPIRGEVVSIGVEPDQSGNVGGTTRFTVKARFSLDESRHKLVRIGMSARLTITTYSNDQALIVPQDALFSANGQTVVQIVDQSSGAVRDTVVELGVATPTGIEVKSGLVAGEIIALH